MGTLGEIFSAYNSSKLFVTFVFFVDELSNLA